VENRRSNPVRKSCGFGPEPTSSRTDNEAVNVAWTSIRGRPIERRPTAVQDACPKVPLSNALLCEQRPRLRDAPEPLTLLNSHGSINSHNRTSTETTQSSSLRNTRQRPLHRKQVLRTALRLEILQMGRTRLLAHSPQRCPGQRDHGRTLQTQRPKRTIRQLFLRQLHR